MEESAVRHVLLRLAECGDSFGHNQTWGGPPDPPLTRAEPPWLGCRTGGADSGDALGPGAPPPPCPAPRPRGWWVGRGGPPRAIPSGGGPAPPSDCHCITRANKRTRRSI